MIKNYIINDKEEKRNFMAQKIKITVNENDEKIEFCKEQVTATIIEFLNYIEKANNSLKTDFLESIKKDYEKLFKKGGNKRTYIDLTEKHIPDFSSLEERELKRLLTDKLIDLSYEIGELRNISPGLTYRPILTNNKTFFLNSNYSTIYHFKNLKTILNGIKNTKIEIFETDTKKIEKTNKHKDTILFGPPGTGKSFDLQFSKETKVFRTTFHPEYTYSDFFGQYKPVVGNHIRSHLNLQQETYEVNGKIIENKKPIVLYDFVPGIFIKAIIKAFEHPETDFILIIEEINRGNCAAIFGDIFQLLDRNIESDESEYPIDLPEELIQYFDSIKNEETMTDSFKAVIEKKQLFLPSNFHIKATMNTSDQSLFPMDMAFKRRWEMKYIPIKYNEEKLKDAYFTTDKEERKQYKWLEFLKWINNEIEKIHNSEDKQLGQWFIAFDDIKKKPNFNSDVFKSKVLSYLFFDVFKFERSRVFKHTSFAKLIECDSLDKIFHEDIFKHYGK